MFVCLFFLNKILATALSTISDMTHTVCTIEHSLLLHPHFVKMAATVPKKW